MSALALVLTLASTDASKPDDPEPPTALEAPAPASAFTPIVAANALSLRLGTLADAGGTAGRTLLAPYAGVGYVHWLGRIVGLGARYDLSSATRGTADVSVTRLGQRFSATVDARWIFHPAFALHGGVGGGASLLVASLSAPSTSETFGRAEGIFVWHASFDIRLPESSVGISLGASGFVGNTLQTAGSVGLEVFF